MNTINYEAIEDEEILFQPQDMTVVYVAMPNKKVVQPKKEEPHKYMVSVHYFIKVVHTDKIRYIIGKQTTGKPNTFLKHIYATRATAQKHVDAKNKSYVGRGKKSAIRQIPHYESL
jgi:hypothetical protein